MKILSYTQKKDYVTTYKIFNQLFPGLHVGMEKEGKTK